MVYLYSFDKAQIGVYLSQSMITLVTAADRQRIRTC